MAALAALYQLPLWLLSISMIVGAQPQPPGVEFGQAFQNFLPRPLIHFKLDSKMGIITSTRNRQNWQSFYTGGATTDQADPAGPVLSVNGSTLPPYSTVFYFNQLIDHNSTKNETFQQRYYFSYEFFEPGGPIFFNVPSESSLDNYDGSVTNSSLNGYLAQMNRGAAVVLEHRFFGMSNPYDDLSEDSLAVLTVDQAIADIVYFAQNVKFPMPDGDKASPSDLPWVLVGGSYPGALTTWTMARHPGMFAAAWASSAVLQAQDFFWSYFDIISQFMPANCSTDIKAVITYLDRVFTAGSLSDQLSAKATFALSNVEYGDDVMAAIREPLFKWQDLQPYYQDTNAGFYAFCNYLEYDRTKQAYETTGNGVGLATALPAYGNWTQYEIRVSGCIGREESCYGTHTANQSVTWSNTTVDDPNRSWAWLYCTELGWFFSGAPANWPTITSRLTTPNTEARLCSLYFPKRFPLGTTADETHNQTAFNIKYGGWSLQTNNTFFSNGRKDPWRAVTVSSDLNPQLSTPLRPIAVASGGFHCSDLVMQAGQSDDSVQAVQNLGIAYMNKWLVEWYDANNVTRPDNATLFPDPSTLPTPTFAPEIIPTSIMYGSWQSNVALGPITLTPSTSTPVSGPASGMVVANSQSGGTAISNGAPPSIRSSLFTVTTFRIPSQTFAIAWIFGLALFPPL